MDRIAHEVVTAEERLLLLMSLAELSEDELLDAHSFAGRVRDWAEFVTLAEDNATVPLVQRNLERANLFSLLPAPLRQRLSARSEAIAAANQARLAVARRFLARFEEAGIPVVILKGVLFAETVYGDPNYKRMNDIDILVRKQDLDAIFAIYESLGFFSAAEVFGGEPRKQEKFSHHAPPFFSRDLACMIGTHWGLITPLSPLTIDYDGIWDRVQPHDFYGIQVLGMCPEDNLHHLCVHLPYYKTGVRELADLYNLVRHTGDAFDWALFRDSMRRAGSQDWVYHALSLANRLVPIPAVGALLAELRDQVSSGIKRDTARKTRRLARLLRSRTVHLSKIEKLFTEVNSTSEPGEKRRAFVDMWREVLFPPADAIERMNALWHPPAWQRALGRLTTPRRILGRFSRDLGPKIFALVLLKTFADVAVTSLKAPFTPAEDQVDLAALAAKLGLTVDDLERLKASLE
ncbi:MAG: nucleotidyltransferase family protein [Planctomycetes bacterium]|nr:nucleotidyltransferase family protein [Planctomycetota bacterium]